MKKIIVIISLLTSILLGQKPETVEPATIGSRSITNSELLSLPEPDKKVVAAVYSFRDQTGQYKAVSQGQSYSTAVTQGGASMLVKALEDSKWFTIVEREALSNLLNERKIISATRDSHAKQNNYAAQPLPSLLFAGIILEGGIISYESNVVTGGFGARYLGVGSHTKMQKDQVTVYLRAVSTQTGEVLKTVHATKSIISRLADAGVYRFVHFKKLLEVETGFSTNEPPQMCVQEAIEKAVLSLIIEGVDEGLWSLKDSSSIDNKIIDDYYAEKAGVLSEQDYSAYKKNDDVGRLSFHIAGGIQMQGGSTNNSFEPAATLGLKIRVNPNFYIGADINASKVGHYAKYNTQVYHADLEGIIDLLPERRFSPQFYGGAFLSKSWAETINGEKISIQRKYPLGLHVGMTFGIGVNHRITDRFMLNTTLDNHIAFSDYMDGVVDDSRTDNFWRVSFGATFNPFKKR